ncbi:MAG TPA: post-COAP-1 domain-containing protein [Pyrinomonadaceae bacterium]
MKSSSRLVVCSVLAATSLALAVAVAVKSQTQTIAGETMFSENANPAGATAPNSLDIVAQCDSSQLNGTVNYTVSGVAAGPFGGTYSESGYFVLQNGDVTAYQANFTITPTGGGNAITGTKNVISGGATGTCSSPVDDEATAEVSGVFSYAANVNGTSNTGTGGMSLDIHDGTETVAAVGHAHASFYGDGKTTGGGHILKAGGNKGVHFGFNAQLKNNGTLDANGVIQDHNSNDRIKILTADSYVSNGVNTTFSGQCEFNGTPQQYEITVSDVDEPGRGVDSFSVTSGSYTRSGILTGGNIQVRGVAVVNPPPTPTPSATPTPSGRATGS